MVAFAEQAGAICDLYQQAQDLSQQGVHVVSTDEKTGMQALERKQPTKPTRPGLIERREFEYIRHGTCCLLAKLEVATGRIITPSIGPRRTEEDFAAHIAQTLETDPEAAWIFIVDGLNTHQSEMLVRLVAARLRIDEDLGQKGKHGILAAMASRRRFLESEEHRIRFVFTPKHCSWLNQVEIWFSILVRRLLRRASFASVEELEARVWNFIGYFNRVLAKPFKWTYTGRPLAA